LESSSSGPLDPLPSGDKSIRFLQYDGREEVFSEKTKIESVTDQETCPKSMIPMHRFGGADDIVPVDGLLSEALIEGPQVRKLDQVIFQEAMGRRNQDGIFRTRIADLRVLCREARVLPHMGNILIRDVPTYSLMKMNGRPLILALEFPKKQLVCLLDIAKLDITHLLEDSGGPRKIALPDQKVQVIAQVRELSDGLMKNGLDPRPGPFPVDMRVRGTPV